MADGFNFDWSSCFQKHFLNFLRKYDRFVSKEYLLAEHKLFTKKLDMDSAYFKIFNCMLPDGKFHFETEILKDGKISERKIFQQTHPWRPFFTETDCPTQKVNDTVPVVHSSLLKFMLKKNSRATVQELRRWLNTPLKDKYFIGRVIVVPQVLVSVQLVVDVPCPEDDSAVRVSLYNFTEQRSNLDFLFPIGSKLIILNPLFKTTQDEGLTLTSYKRSDVFTISDELLFETFPEMKWPEDLPVLINEVTEEIDLNQKVGNEHFVKGNYLEAVNYYSQALIKFPLDETLLSNRAAAYLRLDKYQEAMIDAERVLSINPSHLKANYRCAKAYVALGKYNEAIEILEKNMPKSTMNGAKDYRLLLDEAYKLKRSNNYPDEFLASKLPDRSVINSEIAEERVNPNQEIEDWKRMGNESFAKENYEKAINYYSQALTKYPLDETLLSNRAAAYLRLDKYQEAIIDAERVLSINPSHPKANYRCAKAYVALGKYDAAIKLLENNMPKINKNAVKECRQLLEKAYTLKSK